VSICRAVRPTILLLLVAVSFRLNTAAPFSKPSHLRAKRQRHLPFEFTPQGLSVKSGKFSWPAVSKIASFFGSSCLYCSPLYHRSIAVLESLANQVTVASSDSCAGMCCMAHTQNDSGIPSKSRWRMFLLPRSPVFRIHRSRRLKMLMRGIGLMNLHEKWWC